MRAAAVCTPLCGWYETVSWVQVSQLTCVVRQACFFSLYCKRQYSRKKKKAKGCKYETSVCQKHLISLWRKHFFPLSTNTQDLKFDILCDKSMGVTSKHLVCVLLQNSVIVLEGDNLAFCLKPKHKFRFEHAWITVVWFSMKKVCTEWHLKK